MDVRGSQEQLLDNNLKWRHAVLVHNDRLGICFATKKLEPIITQGYVAVKQWSSLFTKFATRKLPEEHLRLRSANHTRTSLPAL